LPYKEQEIVKKYYSIGEVADMLNVATSLIRFWESEFDIIKPKKNRKGNRQFTTEDIENVKLIYHLVKEKGYTLQGAKELLKKNPQDIKESMSVLESLKKVRSFLVELKNQLPG
jgi:DNA-binding transcriptional MerR regulator